MSKYLDRALALRAQVTPHINCAQAVLLPFAGDAGIPEETAMRVADGFGGGMKRASVCGAVTGGIMVLGLFGLGDPGTLREYHEQLQANHNGLLDCGELLRVNSEAGGEKKPYCDGIVGECVCLVEKILREKGKLGE